ncbi:Dabb family protein [Blastopirellula sp. J2-11]|uniref:Dabb family protein n=1 Tax=Blastopirellula sp. J2-11 TaxID=2943192 RepID=UPI0021C64142|nr:Dabb family protein [Blastopirellula sp. J2-11]UUO06432.1 Dabb family protein [Blastopirellula sp. J2-11]
MIEHTVTFRLKPSLEPQIVSDFMQVASELANIPGVQEFAIRRQVSPKCAHSFGITMKFDSQATYDHYSSHPMHEAFVKNYWLKHVEDFQEVDFLPLD